jgi:hypothetical protein
MQNKVLKIFHLSHNYFQRIDISRFSQLRKGNTSLTFFHWSHSNLQRVRETKLRTEKNHRTNTRQRPKDTKINTHAIQNNSANLTPAQGSSTVTCMILSHPLSSHTLSSQTHWRTINSNMYDSDWIITSTCSRTINSNMYDDFAIRTYICSGTINHYMYNPAFCYHNFLIIAFPLASSASYSR